MVGTQYNIMLLYTIVTRIKIQKTTGDIIYIINRHSLCTENTQNFESLILFIFILRTYIYFRFFYFFIVYRFSYTRGKNKTNFIYHHPYIPISTIPDEQFCGHLRNRWDFAGKSSVIR